MDSDRPFSVLATHRPRRVAFLVELDTAPAELLTEIVDFSVDCWGGRHNLIIPVMNKTIYEDYWRLLCIADPDVIYCYAEIDSSTIERFDHEIGPTRMGKHRESPAGPKPDFRPVLRDQVSTRGILSGFHEAIPAHLRRVEEPSVLCFDRDRKGKEIQAISAFVHVNFGVSYDAFLSVRDHGVPGKFPADYSNVGVMDCIAASWNLILPLNVCAQAPLKRKAAHGRTGNDFLICFGDSVWNVAHFWNYVYFRDPGQPWHGGIGQLWLPPAVMQQPEEFRALLNFIARKVCAGGQRRLKIVSYDHDIAELNQIAKRICSESRGSLFPDNSEKLICGSFPASEPQLPLEFFRRQPQHHHLRGRKVFLEIEKPEELVPDRGQVWMMDLKIQDPYQEKYFVNLEPWWKLPKRRRLAKLFARPGASRIGPEGELSVEIMAGMQSIELSIPFKHEIFHALLVPESSYTTVDDLRHSTTCQPTKGITLSDKGKYLNGLISLAGSLSQATYMFEHPFWHKILKTLCCPELSEQLRAKVSKDLSKELSQFVKDYAENTEVARGWLTEKIVEAGQRIPRGDNPLTYAEIETARKAYIDSLDSEHEKGHTRSADLKRELSELTHGGLLLQGAEIRCELCMSKFWYHVDEIGKLVDCKGCRASIPLPAELEWSYQPNELLRAGVRYHGLVPVLRTIRALFRQAHECFIFVAGMKLYEYRENKPVFTHEVDLSWIKDGQFGIAEVKQSTKLFSTRDYERLVEIACLAKPHVVLIAATEGLERDLDAGGQQLKTQLSAKGIATTVEVWGPAMFAQRSRFG